MILGGADIIIIEIKCTENLMTSIIPKTTHPPTPSLWSVEKLSSVKPVPGAKKVGDPCSKPKAALLLWIGKDL